MGCTLVEKNLDMTKGVYRRLYAACCKGRRINSVSAIAELVFWRIHSIADDYGTFEAEPVFVKSQAFPLRKDVNERQIRSSLEELRAANLIRLFECNSEKYGVVTDFLEMQPAGRNGKRIQRFPRESGGILGNPNVRRGEIVSDTDTDTDTDTNPGAASPVSGNGNGRPPSKVKSTSILPPGFIRFWNEWPNTTRKVARGQCLKVWMQLGCEEKPDEVVEAVRQFKNSGDWMKQGGQFIPGPLVWLRHEAWDVPKEAFSKPKDDWDAGIDDKGTPESNAARWGMPLKEYAETLQCKELFPNWRPPC